jgi:hypothetical protein
MQHEEDKIFTKNEIKRRMCVYFDSAGLKKHTVAVDMGFAKSTFNNHSDAMGALIQRFHEFFPEVDLHWLLTGEGSMKISSQNFDTNMMEQLAESKKVISTYEKAIEMLYSKFREEKSNH